MINPTGLRVLGLTGNGPDAQMLNGSIEQFQSKVINTVSLEKKSNDFMGSLKGIMENINPHIVILFISDIISAVKLLSLLKGISENLVGSHPYWVAITRETEQKDLTEMLGELDVDAVYLAPFTCEQLSLNLTTGYEGCLTQQRLEKQCQQASETARIAMEAASEIGYVMQLVDNLSHVGTYDEVGSKLFKVFDAMGIKSFLQIFDGHDTYVFSDLEVNESVQHIFSNAMSSNVRMLEHKRLLLLKLDYIIIMVTNAPWQDESKYGRIKDLICQVGPVLEARVRTIMVNNLIEEQHEKVMSIMNMMRQLSMDTQNNTRRIMQGLSSELEVAAVSLDLNEQQENHLLGLSSGALDSLETLYMTNDALEGHFLNLMRSITRVRELTSEQMRVNGEPEGDGDSVELF